jgi:hypothetical protein
MSDGLDFQVKDTDQFNRAIRALIGSTPEIQEGSLEVIREMAELASADAKFNIETAPIKGTTRGNAKRPLRMTIARGVFVRELADHSGYMIGTSMPEDDELIIPRGFDVAVGGHWRHPLFGDTTRQYENYGFSSWFMLPMNEATDDGRAKLVSLLEQVAENTARMSS